MMVGFCERMTGEVRIAQHVQVLRNCGKGRHSCLIMKDKSRWCQFYGLLGKDIVQAVLSLSFFRVAVFPFYYISDKLLLARRWCVECAVDRGYCGDECGYLKFMMMVTPNVCVFQLQIAK